MHQKILAYSFAILIAVAVLRLAGPHSASAVVNELTLTGVPPNTVVTLTNETGEKEERRTGDDGGSIVIPLIDRNWETGKYKVTITDKDGKTTSQQITLTDGVNKFELGTLFTSLVTPKIPFRISDSVKMPIPETATGETLTTAARGAVSGLLGGFLGGRSRGGNDGGDRPSLPLRPPYPEQTLTAKDGKTKMNLSGACDRDACQFTVGVKESPGNGAPHWILLQDNKGNVVQPAEVQVYEIWEVWGGWRMTVSWTKSYYQDGQLVRQERGGWTTGWITFVERYKSPAEIPSIWKDFGGKPFEGIRGVVADFKFPEGFNPADWNLVAHVTTKDGPSIVTQPFVAAMTKGERGVLSFTQREQTFWESTM